MRHHRGGIQPHAAVLQQQGEPDGVRLVLHREAAEAAGQVLQLQGLGAQAMYRCTLL